MKKTEEILRRSAEAERQNEEVGKPQMGWQW